MLTTDSAERKNIPLHSGCYAYFPDALAAVAELSKKGNDKHNPGQPLHWSRDKSNDHADCIARHIQDAGKDFMGTDIDGTLHVVQAAWRALALAQVVLECRAKGKPFSPSGYPAAKPESDDDGWIPWHGYVDVPRPQGKVCVRLRCGYVTLPRYANNLRWSHGASDHPWWHNDIIAYKFA